MTDKDHNQKNLWVSCKPGTWKWTRSEDRMKSKPTRKQSQALAQKKMEYHGGWFR